MPKKQFKNTCVIKTQQNLKYILKIKLRYKILILSLLVVIPLVNCGTSRPENIGNICEIFREKSGWYDDAKASSNKWGTEIPVMMAIMRQESAFIGYAKPPRTKLLGFIPWKRPSSAKGYAQAIDGTWNAYIEDAGGMFSSRYDFEDAIDFVGWHMKTQGNKVAKAPLNDAYKQYLVYHEGLGGYRRKSYNKKKWLIKVAGGVKKRSAIYKKQLSGCEQEFQKSWWEKLWSF